jgi:Amt family ammonium transporter
VEEVLDISKIESGRTELNLKRLSPHRILASVSKVMAPVLDHRGQKLNIVTDKKLPDLYVDESKLEQVLFNLLSNAARFSPDNAEIKVEAVRQESQCHFSVIDRGVGIRPEDRKRIFEPFFHINTPFIKDEEGTGLGLTVAKSIVEKHGGRMWMESECDSGSTFCFTVPLKPEVKQDL